MTWSGGGGEIETAFIEAGYAAFDEDSPDEGDICATGLASMKFRRVIPS